MINNYTEFEQFLTDLKERPKLLLHSCCAPCSTAVLERLLPYFDISVYFYNPNIYPEEEYIKRKNEEIKLLKELDIKYIDTNYENELFKKEIAGLEQEKEGGKRCKECIKMRLQKSAIYAKENDFDFFTTTLSISPHKNSKLINEIGYELEKKYNISYLFSDFKKKDGFKRSIDLSNKYNLYRQNYCGCQYSIK